MLMLLGAGLWLGGFVMLGFGVAPVNFSVAQQWGLQGENPRMAEQTVHHRTIAGELTGNSIARFNIVESVCFFMMVSGLLMAWYLKTGSRPNLMVRTTLMLLVGILFYYYAIRTGARLMEIRNTVPIDFSVTETALKPAVHLEFDRLHKAYTRTASIAMLLIAAFFTLTVFDAKPSRKKTS